MRLSKTPSTLVHFMLRWVVLLWVFGLLGISNGLAHEIPSDAQVTVFLKQEPQTLTVLIRTPMSAMKEVEFPLVKNIYLDLPKVQPSLEQAAQLWFTDNLKISQNNQLLQAPTVAQARISLPSNRSFASYEEALTHVRVKNWELPDNLVWSQQYLDIELTYPMQSNDTKLAIDFGLQRLALRVAINLRFQLLGSDERAFELNAKEGVVLLNPSIWQASWRFMQLGFEHILSGTDHLLFITSLILVATGWMQLLGVITSFTVAHSVTLIASALGYAPSGLWFMPWVELAIAFSIVFMALENIWNPKVKRRWIMCTLFGLIHGFGFSFVLHETLQFAGSHLLVSLLSFNLGVEAGQILVLAIGIPLVRLMMSTPYARMMMIVFSALIAHVAWHWMAERWDTAAKFLPMSF
ncbi:MAG: HupE/UreJ family protein [Burkholderiaceae bacterium]